MNFAELQAGVFDDLQYQAAPKPGVQERVRRYLNEGLERVLRRPRLKNLRLGLMQLTTVPGEGFYGAPLLLERIDYVIDKTNGRKLEFRTRDWYRQLDPSVRTSGTPSIWIPEGVTPACYEPRLSPDGKQRFFAQSHLDIDRTQIVRLRCSYIHGNEIMLTAQLQGLTPVELGPFPIVAAATNTRVQVTSLSLDATCSGWVFIGNADEAIPPGHYMAYIAAGDTSARQLGIRFYPTPTDAITYDMEGQRVIPRMKYDDDEPPFPDDFHEMLQCYARARVYRKDGRLAQSQAEMAEFERYCLDLTAAVEYPVSYKPVAGKLAPGTHGWSDLGPWYPADRS